MNIDLMKSNSIKELELLKMDIKFDINQTNSSGKSALFHADFEKSCWLIKNGINIHHKDRKNKSALFFCNHHKKFDLLIKSGANPYHLDLYKRSFMYYMNNKMISYLLSDNCPLDLTPIINQKDNNTDPLLFIISKKWELSDFDKFINKGGNLYARNTQKEDILFYLLLQDKTNLIISLLKKYKFKKLDTIYNNGCVPATYKETGNLLEAFTEEYHKHEKIINYLWENHNIEFRSMFNRIDWLHENSNQDVKTSFTFLQEYVVRKDKETLIHNLAEFEFKNSITKNKRI